MILPWRFFALGPSFGAELARPLKLERALSRPERTPDGENAGLPLSWWSTLEFIVSGILGIPWVRRRFPRRQP